MQVNNAAPLFTVKDLLWFAYLYPFRTLAGRMPRGILHGLGKMADPLVQFRSGSQRASAVRAMLTAGISPERAALAGRQFISNATVRILDDLLMISGKGAPQAHVEGLDQLERARSQQRGVLLLSVHTYATRLAKRYMGEAGYPILTVRNQRPPDLLAGRLGRRYLQPRYMEFLHQVIQDEVYIQDPECSLKILKRLRSGGLVNIHLDAPRTAASLLEWPFLGALRTFPSGPFDIVRVSKCAVLPMFCGGCSTGLRIRFGAPPALPDSTSREEFARAHLSYFAKLFEEQIMSHPEEWELWTRL